MPQQDPAYYAAMTSTFPEPDEPPYKPRVRKKSTWAGIEKLVLTGTDPRYELLVSDAPLLAAQRFNIRLQRYEREALQKRPRAVAVAINEFCWDFNGSGAGGISGIERLLLKGAEDRHRELVSVDPFGATRKFKIKLSESEAMILGNIKRKDLNTAINAAEKHMLNGQKVIPGRRVRLQQGPRGRVFAICATVPPRQSSDDQRRKMQALLNDLFDEDKPLPAVPGWRMFWRGTEEGIGAPRRRRRGGKRRNRKAMARRARRERKRARRIRMERQGQSTKVNRGSKRARRRTKANKARAAKEQAMARRKSGGGGGGRGGKGFGRNGGRGGSGGGGLRGRNSSRNGSGGRSQSARGRSGGSRGGGGGGYSRNGQGAGAGSGEGRQGGNGGGQNRSRYRRGSGGGGGGGHRQNAAGAGSRGPNRNNGGGGGGGSRSQGHSGGSSGGNRNRRRNNRRGSRRGGGGGGGGQ